MEYTIYYLQYIIYNILFKFMPLLTSPAEVVESYEFKKKNY